jgi:tetratricopeptide (TPR) repeat protein
LAVAEGALDFGLTEVAGQLLGVCRTLISELIVQSDQLAIAAPLQNLEGLLALRTGRIGDAETLLRSAVQANRDAGDDLGEALAQQNLAAALWLSGNISEARACASEAFDSYRQNDDVYRQAQMLVNLANYDLEDGLIEEAITRLNDAEDLATGPLFTGLRASILGTRGLVARAQGDQELAGRIHRTALRRARRNGTVNHVRIATQNIGAWCAETNHPLQAATWLRKAAELAKREGNRILEAQLIRSQAIQLSIAGKQGPSRAVMREALKLSMDIDDGWGMAEASADLAAFIISASEHRAKPNEPDPPSLEEAGALLRQSLAVFEQSGDTLWIQRVLANSASLALAKGDPLGAIDHLIAARDGVNSDTGARINLDRRAASIAVRDARRPDLAAEFIRHSANEIALTSSSESGDSFDIRYTESVTAPAWELALGATQLRDYSFALGQALELFAEASSSAEGADPLLFHITNDFGSTYDQADKPNEAIECFDRCLEIAGRLDDRVMRQQALANRAEMGRRRGESGMIGQFEEAIRLADDLGDVEAEIESLLNLASARVDANQLIEAEENLALVEGLSERIQSQSEFIGRLYSIRGNISWAREEFELAHKFYLSSAGSSVGEAQVESMAAALVTLARMRRRDEYRSLLRKVIRQGQRAGLDGATATAIMSSAKEWAEADVVSISAKTYVEAIELALNEWIHELPVGSDRSEAGTTDTSDDVPSVIANRMDAFIYVIARMWADLSGVSLIQAKVVRQVIKRLERDLPSELNDLVVTWIQQAEAILAEARSASPGTR